MSSQVFHYYGPALKFVQMVRLSDLPSSLVSNLQFELYPFMTEFILSNSLSTTQRPSKGCKDQHQPL